MAAGVGAEAEVTWILMSISRCSEAVERTSSKVCLNHPSDSAKWEGYER